MKGSDGMYDKNIIKATVHLQSGCSWDKGEFDIYINEIVQGYVGEDDWDLIYECAWEYVNPHELENPSEFAYMFTFIETGEREGVGWLRYYEIDPDCIPVNVMQ
jgi:hypothetical protein